MTSEKELELSEKVKYLNGIVSIIYPEKISVRFNHILELDLLNEESRIERIVSDYNSFVPKHFYKNRNEIRFTLQEELLNSFSWNKHSKKIKWINVYGMCQKARSTKNSIYVDIVIPQKVGWVLIEDRPQKRGYVLLGGSYLNRIYFVPEIDNLDSFKKRMEKCHKVSTPEIFEE